MISLKNIEDRGNDFEEVVKKLSSFSRVQKERIVEQLGEMIIHDLPSKYPSRKIISTISSLEQLIIRYPNVDFAGFISRESDKEKYQLWKLIDAFEEVSKKIGISAFKKLKITLIVFGHKVTYISNGTIAVNYERFSEEDLVKQLMSMARQQGS